MSSKKQGFASFTREKHIEASRRGGQAKVPKGTAVLSPEDRIKRASAAGSSRWDKVRAERSSRAAIKA